MFDTFEVLWKPRTAVLTFFPFESMSLSQEHQRLLPVLPNLHVILRNKLFSPDLTVLCWLFWGNALLSSQDQWPTDTHWLSMIYSIAVLDYNFGVLLLVLLTLHYRDCCIRAKESTFLNWCILYEKRKHQRYWPSNKMLNICPYKWSTTKLDKPC